MADTLTKSQADLFNVAFEVADEQRAFVNRHGNALADLRRAIVWDAAIATSAGLVLGTIVGVVATKRRRAAQS